MITILIIARNFIIRYTKGVNIKLLSCQFILFYSSLVLSSSGATLLPKDSKPLNIYEPIEVEKVVSVDIPYLGNIPNSVDFYRGEVAEISLESSFFSFPGGGATAKSHH